MLQRIFLLWLSLVCLNTSVEAGKRHRAILLSNPLLQIDSIGYNLPAELASDMSLWAKEGRVKLWESPEKKHRILPEEIISMEKSLLQPMSGANQVLLYMEYSGKGRVLRPELKGIALLTQKGQDKFSWGYVEADKPLKRLLMQSYILPNYSGEYGMTLQQSITAADFDYDFLYWDDKMVESVPESNGIKSEFLKKPQHPMAQHKLISYELESAELLEACTKYFQEHPEQLTQYSGQKTESKKVLISGMEVFEIWDRSQNPMAEKLVQINLRMFEPLPVPMKPEDKAFTEIRIGKSGLAELLRGKLFPYRITRINGSPVSASQSLMLKPLLRSGKWESIGSVFYPLKN